MLEKTPSTTVSTDSIWDERSQTFMLTKKGVMAQAQACVESHDTNAMGLLLNETTRSCYPNNYLQEILALVCLHDELDMARALFSPQGIKEWCNCNIAPLIRKCPKLFEQWVVDPKDAVSCIASCVAPSGEHAKLWVLEGRGETAPEKRLHALLEQDPGLWAHMPIAWIGDKGSMLRAKAEMSGWTPALLPQKIMDYWTKRVSSWTNILDYPYSLCIAVESTKLLQSKKEAMALNASGQRVVMTISGLPKLGKSALAPVEPLHPSPAAGSVDIALAQIILERVQMPHIVLKTLPGAAVVSSSERAALAAMVDMHMSLDCMNLLVEALARDTIPGQNTKIESVIELPELDSAVR